jgi:hypothetical protein
MKGIKGRIHWESKNVLLANRVFLFCIDEKCMSGRIKSFLSVNIIDEFEITVDFIEPDFFKSDLIIGRKFTIREASKIIATGEIKEII